MVTGCIRHDPVLPGERYNIFDNNDVIVTGQQVPELKGDVKNIFGDSDCKYRQDEKNNIWKGDTKVYTGFSTTASVASNQSPICVGNHIYTGFSTGEVVKINPANGNLVWSADLFRANNLTGGASVVDVVAHVGVDGNYVYAGGLGNAFCKLKAYNGDKVWCLNISVPVDFIFVDDFAFVVGTDNYLYAINTNDGTVYWKTEIEEQVKPEYKNGFIIVDDQEIDYKTGIEK